jgi:hypothetical protein
MSNRLLLSVFVAMTLFIAATACSRILQPISAPDGPAPQGTQTMKPSITYAYLLRQTPFFTGLDSTQLHWVIQHSREWEVQAGQVIVSSQHPGDSSGYWVLLDGGWDLEYPGRTHASGHTDPGKWFNQDQFSQQPFKLEANDHGYVMHITTQDMDDMLARGFDFQRHLDAGKTLYRALESESATPPINQPAL